MALTNVINTNKENNKNIESSTKKLDDINSTTKLENIDVKLAVISKDTAYLPVIFAEIALMRANIVKLVKITENGIKQERKIIINETKQERIHKSIRASVEEERIDEETRKKPSKLISMIGSGAKKLAEPGLFDGITNFLKNMFIFLGSGFVLGKLLENDKIKAGIIDAINSVVASISSAISGFRDIISALSNSETFRENLTTLFGNLFNLFADMFAIGLQSLDTMLNSDAVSGAFDKIKSAIWEFAKNNVILSLVGTIVLFGQSIAALSVALFAAIKSFQAITKMLGGKGGGAAPGGKGGGRGGGKFAA
jgi:hypothetical protein